jgi:hypothetical protein
MEFLSLSYLYSPSTTLSNMRGGARPRPISEHPLDFPLSPLYNGDMSDLPLFSVLEKDEWGISYTRSARHYEGAKINHQFFQTLRRKKKKSPILEGR